MEQKFCSKCGKTNWSNWFEVCHCKEPNFVFDGWDEWYLYQKQKAQEQADK